MQIPLTARLMKAMMRPETVVRALLKKTPMAPFSLRMAMDAFERPWFAHGVLQAAEMAARLRIPSIAIAEFGVASGNGLVALGKVAAEVERETRVCIEIYGFDTGEGMPEETGYRDLPYIWRKSMYKMDVAAVKRRLDRRTTLVIGNVRDTVPQWLNSAAAPLGFLSFDMDFYSSTIDAFRIFEGADERYLPRVFCYFDDIHSAAMQYHCQDVGEMAAIEEFNSAPSQNHRIRPIHGFKRGLLWGPEWADSMRMYHRFGHARYNDYVGE